MAQITSKVFSKQFSLTLINTRVKYEVSGIAVDPFSFKYLLSHVLALPLL